MKALGGAKVPKTEFGRFNADGTISIDHKALEGLKKKLGPIDLEKSSLRGAQCPVQETIANPSGLDHPR